VEDELLRALESFANEPFNLKHHAAYIRLALQMEGGGEIATDRSQMVNAVCTSNRRQLIRVLSVYQSPPNNITHIEMYSYHY